MDRSDLRGSTSVVENYPGTYTEVIQEEPSTQTSTTSVSTATNTIRLRLAKNPTRSSRRVSWTSDTVDNELMNKKKSKCCCIFQKTKNWNESSSEDENDDHDCKHCKGHKKSDFNSIRAQKEKNEPDTVIEHDDGDGCNSHHHHRDNDNDKNEDSQDNN